MYNIVKAQENLLQNLLLGLQKGISKEKTKRAGIWDSILNDMVHLHREGPKASKK